MPPPDSTLLRRLSGWLQGHPAVRTEKLRAVWSPQLGNRRTITVYLPPGYSDDREHPLLVVHDGQDMDAWKLAGALARQHAAGRITPVVAALPALPHRVQEYGTAGRPNVHGQGARAAEFQAFVTDTVVPLLRRRYQLWRNPAHTALLGASLGGLSAFDLAWRRPDLFGLAGVFSGSFWWRTSDASAAEQQASRIVHQIVRETARRPPLRLWFQAGTRDEEEDRDGNGVIDAIQDTTELIDELVAKGFQRGRDVVYRETAGGRHHPTTWAQELPEFLHWAFPTPRSLP
jgi:enterochelin esterase family protein